MDKTLRVALLFGGVSSEHEVSCVSAQTFMDALLADGYTVYPIYIDRSGRWFLYEGDLTKLAEAPRGEYQVSVAVRPGMRENALITVSAKGETTLVTDVVIPVLHGLNGEDGTVQGLLELTRIPYAGCGVLASAVSMDKVFTKKIVAHLGICQADYVDLTRREIRENPKGAVGRILAKFPEFPVFVKPSRAGSSVGTTKVHTLEELVPALLKAAAEDRRVLVEECIDGREVECAVRGDYGPEASNVGEILAAAEFYDYEAKYANADSQTVIPADIDDSVREEIRRDAVEIFKAVDGWGLARVDFFIRRRDSKVIFNEINTFPGFTPISMWPMLWADKGTPVSEQIRLLIRSALEREPLYGA
ncbi:MAG: D-alanine--D-alanine ligase [Firmicutes bacterium]|nr:D-alanine--D-alanine ligase [Bacillota bacterium]MBQ5960815.1 D-alanine--D-alanine ligase [Bacillota bacterium]